MSALEELWLWLQGRSSRTEAGPEGMESAADMNHEARPSPADEAAPGDAARVERNWRYRAGPWQMK